MDNFHSLLDAVRNIKTKGGEKTDWFLLASVFSSKINWFWVTQPPELDDRNGEQKEDPIIQGEMISDFLCLLDIHKFMGSDGIHPRLLMELVEELTEPLSIIYQQSWWTREILVAWRLTNVRLICSKFWKEYLTNKPVGLISEEGYGSRSSWVPLWMLSV